MTQYLQQAIERVTLERLKGRDNTYGLSTWAVSFRKGCSARIVEMVEDQREAALAQEREKIRKATRKASGASTATALTVATFAKSELEANADFIHGEGWSAKKAAERAERAAEREQEMREYTQWCKDNPEDAAAQVREDEKREERNAKRRTGRSYWSSRGDGTDMSAYYAGYDAAKSISIHQQADSKQGKTARLTGSKDIRL